MGVGQQGGRVEFSLPKSVCGHCGEEIDAASGHDERPPQAGDWALCGCGGLSRFVEGGRVEMVTRQEEERLSAEQRAALALSRLYATVVVGEPSV